MKITDVDLFQINPPLAARNADQKVRFFGIDTQTVYRAKTDNGIVGYGDDRGHHSPPESKIAVWIRQVRSGVSSWCASNPSLTS